MQGKDSIAAAGADTSALSSVRAVYRSGQIVPHVTARANLDWAQSVVVKLIKPVNRSQAEQTRNPGDTLAEAVLPERGLTC